MLAHLALPYCFTVPLLPLLLTVLYCTVVLFDHGPVVPSDLSTPSRLRESSVAIAKKSGFGHHAYCVRPIICDWRAQVMDAGTTSSPLRLIEAYPVKRCGKAKRQKSGLILRHPTTTGLGATWIHTSSIGNSHLAAVHFCPFPWLRTPWADCFWSHGL